MSFLKRLSKNQHGFSHQLLLPIAVIAAVTAVGGYVLKRSHAENFNPYYCPAPQPSLAGFDTDTAGHYPCVHYLQYVLRNDASQSSVTVNGYFDQATVNGVKNVQHIAGLTMNGIVGTSTWQVINMLNASNTPPSTGTFYYNTAGIHHNAGGCAVNNGVDGGVTDPCNGTGWAWAHDTTGEDSTTAEMQYGPYRDMSVPLGKHGFRVCFNYTNPTNATVYSDVTYNNTGTRVALGGFTRNDLTYCNYVPLTPGMYRSMEFRFRVLSAPLGTYLVLKSTTVNPY